MLSRRPPCPAFASALILAAVVALALLPIGATGCAALNKLFHPAAVSPGENAVIVNAERSIESAFIVCDEFVALDDANRETFPTQLPAVHAAAQEIRRKGQTYFPTAWDAVQLLKTSPTAAQGDEVQRQLAQVQTLATLAQQLTAQATASPGVTIKPAPPRDSAARFRRLVTPATAPSA